MWFVTDSVDVVKRVVELNTVSMAVDLDMVADKADRAHMVKVLTDKVEVMEVAIVVAVVVSDELENTSMDIKYDPLLDSDRTVEMQG